MNIQQIIKIAKNPLNAIYADSLIERLVPKRRKHAILISLPKSGTTWLGSTLVSLLDWQTAYILPNYGRREQELDRHRLLFNRGENIVTPGVHTRCNEETLKILDLAQSKSIFLFRDIFDIVVSFKDHMNRESVAWPMAYIDEATWANMDNERQLDFLIDMVVPWYFNFYCGWVHSEIFADKQRSLCLTYQQLKNDIHQTLHQICHFLEEARTDEDIDKALAISKERNFRKNKGVAGRGTQQLSLNQKRKICSLANYYPDIDFQLIGLTDEMIPMRNCPEQKAARIENE